MSQRDSQVVTLETYEVTVNEYIAGTPTTVGEEFKPFLERFAALVGMGMSILEIGSATGRDADYLEFLGLDVVRTDAVSSFVKYLHTQNKSAQLFNVLTDDLNRAFKGIIAQAVFLHFTQQQFTTALDNIKKHLQPQGLFALSVKFGEGEGFEDHKLNKDRYFKYWSEESLRKILEENNFTVMETFRPEKGKWIQVITRLT